MNWQQLYGHDQQQEMFQRAIQRGRLGQAYLLTGPSGIGKRTFASLLAQSLLCRQRGATELTACGQCAGCRQVQSGTHPDFMQVGLPEGKTELPIEVFVGSSEKRGREGLCHELSLSPMQGGYRIALIDDADSMNVASANALLKTLEEPGPGAVLILIAEDADQVIQTIRSRCQQVFFGPLSPEDLRLALQNLADTTGELTEAQRESAILQSKGSVSRALQWLGQNEQQAGSQATFVKLLRRGAFRAADLAVAGEAVMGQFGSDTHSQREGALAIVTGCLEYCHEQLTRLESSAPASEEIGDAWAEALELCLDTTIQIERRAAVLLCLDAFYQELEIRLHPTWKKAAARS